MHRWQVGDVEVVRIEDEDFALGSDQPVPAWAVAAGLAPSAAETYLAFTAYGIRSGDRRIVVDPWIANDHPRTLPEAGERADGLLAQLAEAGFAADDVDQVVLTHVDGRGWVTRPDADGWRLSFPAARHLIHQDERAAVEQPEELFDGDELRPLTDAGVLDAFADPPALTDAVRLESAPGHNFGHVAVWVESGDQLAVLAGHLFLTVFDVADPTPGPLDGPDAETSRRRILDELADREGLLLLPLVGGPSGGAGRVERDGGGYRLVAP